MSMEKVYMVGVAVAVAEGDLQCFHCGWPLVWQGIDGLVRRVGKEQNTCCGGAKQKVRARRSLRKNLRNS